MGHLSNAIKTKLKVPLTAIWVLTKCEKLCVPY